MKRVALAAAAVLVCTGLQADNVPFAQPNTRSATSQPGLGNLMSLVQLRHIKLWFAGDAENWELLKYEVQQINDVLGQSALLYENIPTGLVGAIGEPIRRIGAAAQKRDVGAFRSAYSDLNATCNACHLAAGVEFIRIRTPTSFPFSDQDLRPR